MLKPLLTANWRYLAMLNFCVDPELLSRYVPRGIELDFHNGTTCLSVVGYLFYHTVVVGLPIARHRNFEEVDLRFYVRKKSGATWRRGVVYMRKLVPKIALPVTARVFAGEPYVAAAMRSEVEERDGFVHVKYEWRRDKRWEHLFITGHGQAQSYVAGSHEEFICERPWSYTARGEHTTEYRVEHPRWKVWPADSFAFEPDLAALYGEQLVESLRAPAFSAFIVDGSHVQVQRRTSERDA